MSAAPGIAQILDSRRWYVFRSSQGGFITSDNPVIRYVPPEHHHPIYGEGGFAHRDCEVSIPLSSDCLLLMADLPMTEGEYQLPESQIMELNRWRVQHCDRYFYARDRNENLIELMRAPPERFTPSLSVGGLADEVEVNVKRDFP